MGVVDEKLTASDEVTVALSDALETLFMFWFANCEKLIVCPGSHLIMMTPDPP